MNRKHPKTLPALLRLVLFGLLLMAWWNPSLPLTAKPADVYLVIDDSFSLSDIGLQQAWRQIPRLVKSLPSTSHIALLRYGSQSVLELPLSDIDDQALHDRLQQSRLPRRLPLDRTHTHTATAIQHVLTLARPERDSHIMLISDGRDHSPDTEHALQASINAGIPIWLFAVDSADEQTAWIESLQLPERALAGDRVPVTLAIHSTAQQQVPIRMSLNGELHRKLNLVTQANKSSVKRWWLELARAGHHRIDVELLDTDNRVIAESRRSRIINVAGPMRVLYLSHSDTLPPLSEALQQTGVDSQQILPRQFPANMDELLNYSAIILDDIDTTMLSDAAWKRLAAAVHDNGLGLLVLGGPQSFSRGSYRHSRLENLLPVIAEPGSPQSSAAVMFLIDTSGSMAGNQQSIDYLDQARRAINHTLKSVSSHDLIGLMRFDIEPHHLLPLQRYAAPAFVLNRLQLHHASGGTRLAPALQAATWQLAQAEHQSRFLILLTDGYVEDESLGTMAEYVKQHSIKIIALVLGNADKTINLERLVKASQGSLIKLTELDALPRLMRRQLEDLRDDIVQGVFIPRPVQPIPFFASAHWPAISGFHRSKEKDTATVYLRSSKQEPLFAVQQSGAGRVAVITSGLGQWASDWQAWEHWPSFAHELINWIGLGQNPRVYSSVRQRPGALEVTLEALGKDMDWSRETQARLLVQDPGGGTQRLGLNPQAAGRFSTRVPAHLDGPHRILIEAGDQRSRHDSYYHAANEQQAWNEGGKNLFDWQQDGLIRPGAWDQTVTITSARADTPMRSLLLTMAVVLYLFMLANERGVFRKLMRRDS